MSIIASRPESVHPAPKSRRKRHPKPRPRPRPRPNPRSSWPAWTDQRWTIVEPLDPPAVAVEGAYTPTPEESAWWAGFGLGVAGECPKVPAGYGERERAYFVAGRLAGFQDSPAGREWAADMRAMRDRPSGEIREEDIYPPGCVS